MAAPPCDVYLQTVRGSARDCKHIDGDAGLLGKDGIHSNGSVFERVCYALGKSADDQNELRSAQSSFGDTAINFDGVQAPPRRGVMETQATATPPARLLQAWRTSSGFSEAPCVKTSSVSPLSTMAATNTPSTTTTDLDMLSMPTTDLEGDSCHPFSLASPVPSRHCLSPEPFVEVDSTDGGRGLYPNDADDTVAIFLAACNAGSGERAQNSRTQPSASRIAPRTPTSSLSSSLTTSERLVASAAAEDRRLRRLLDADAYNYSGRGATGCDRFGA